jgi:hypothetical protein
MVRIFLVGLHEHCRARFAHATAAGKGPAILAERLAQPHDLAGKDRLGSRADRARNALCLGKRTPCGSDIAGGGIGAACHDHVLSSMSVRRNVRAPVNGAGSGRGKA